MKVPAPKVSVIEVDSEGLMSLLGKQVELRCVTYIYTGTLVGVNDTCVKLDNAAIVYETGAHDAPLYKDAQKIGDAQYVSTGLIESFGESKKLY